MKCKHENAVIKYDCDGLPDPLELSWRECLDCGAWLSLGPSNDRIPLREFLLARLIAEAYCLFDREHSREVVTWAAIEECRGMR